MNQTNKIRLQTKNKAFQKYFMPKVHSLYDKSVNLTGIYSIKESEIRLDKLRLNMSRKMS